MRHRIITCIVSLFLILMSFSCRKGMRYEFSEDDMGWFSFCEDDISPCMKKYLFNDTLVKDIEIKYRINYQHICAEGTLFGDEIDWYVADCDMYFNEGEKFSFEIKSDSKENTTRFIFKSNEIYVHDKLPESTYTHMDSIFTDVLILTKEETGIVGFDSLIFKKGVGIIKMKLDNGDLWKLIVNDTFANKGYKRLASPTSS